MRTDATPLRMLPGLFLPFGLGVQGDLFVKELKSQVWREGARMSHLERVVNSPDPQICYLCLRDKGP